MPIGEREHEITDLTLIAQTVAEHEGALQLLASEVLELRKLIDQNLIRKKLLERRGRDSRSKGGSDGPVT